MCFMRFRLKTHERSNSLFLIKFCFFSPGTHGHMKCTFDGQLKSQDTVLLHLYKRMFPKWTYEDCIVTDKDNDAMEQAY